VARIKHQFSVFVGIVCVIAAVIGELVLYSRHKEEKNEMAEYTSAFETVRIAMSKEEDALDQSVFEAEDGSEDEAEDEAEALDELDENDTEVLAEQDMLDGDIEDIEEEE